MTTPIAYHVYASDEYGETHWLDCMEAETPEIACLMHMAAVIGGEWDRPGLPEEYDAYLVEIDDRPPLPLWAEKVEAE